MNKSYINIIISVLAATLMLACGENEKPVPLPELARRSVLVYMVADNNLGASGYDTDDLDEMRAGSNDIPSDCRLLVFNSPWQGEATLTEVKNGRLDTLKVYTSDLTSIESERMLEVFADFSSAAAATDGFGLILWSHASGWIQDGIEDPIDAPMPKSFGYKNGKTMNTTTLARTLEKSGMWDFVYFDCCYMGSVESIYELRNSARHIVASPTELPSPGMPYHLNLRHFFAEGEADLVGAAKETFGYYNAQSGQARTCTMAVYDTSAMGALADAVADIFERASGTLPADYVPQKYTMTTVWKCNYFDLRDYIRTLCLYNEEEQFEGAGEAYAEFEKALADVVLYEDATPYLWNSVALAEHCGLSTFIRRAESDSEKQNYTSLAWFGDVASKLKFQ